MIRVHPIYVKGPRMLPPAGPPPAGEDYVTKLWAYYECEDQLSAEQMTDSGPNGFHVAQYYPYPADILRVAGKLGNAVNLSTVTFRTSTNANFNFHGLDFCIRCWVKVNSLKPPTANTAFIARNPWQLSWQQYDGTIRWMAGSYVYTPAPLSQGVWHRLIAWYRHSASEIGLKVDDDTPVTQTGAAPSLYSTARFWFTGTSYDNEPAAPDLHIDEVAIWKDYVLTHADMTYDWNNGAGRGKPV